MNHLANFKEEIRNLQAILGRRDDFVLNGHAPKTTYAMGEVFEKKGVEHDMIRIFKLNDNATIGFSFSNYKSQKSDDVLVEIGLKKLDTKELITSKPINLKEFRVVLRDIVKELELLKSQSPNNDFDFNHITHREFLDTFSKYLDDNNLNEFLNNNMKNRNLKQPSQEVEFKNPIDILFDNLTIPECIQISNEFRMLKNDILPNNSLLSQKAGELAKSLNFVQPTSAWLETIGNRVNEILADEFKKLSEKVANENALNFIMSR